MVITTPKLGQIGAPTHNDVQMGLYQAAVSVLPMTMWFLKSGWLGQVFQTDGRAAIYLTNRRTLHRELVMPTGR
jgi:Na+-transporting methylmalonyl-CoA/oxaloacetate decarboxylase beta subunit